MVDESDKLFEAGHQGFRDQLGAIYQACDSHQIRRAFFSATFAHEVEEWCRLNLDNVVMLTVGQKNSATALVDQSLVFVGSEGGKLMAFRNLLVEVMVQLFNLFISIFPCCSFISSTFTGTSSTCFSLCTDERKGQRIVRGVDL